MNFSQTPRSQRVFTSDVKIKGIQTFSLTAFALLLVGSLLSSCKENISTIGSDYVNDSVFRGTAALTDASVLRFSSQFKPTVAAEGRTFNLNLGSPYLFVGNVPSEGLSAWSVIKVPFIQDSVGRILDDSLVLHMSNPFYYGSGSASTLLEFDVYVSSTVTDSAASLSQSDLSGTPVAHYSGLLDVDSTRKIVLQLDTARVFPLLRTAQLSLVIVPTANMSSIRAFASADNGSASLNPTLQLTIATATGSYSTVRYPDFDYHFVTESASVPAGMFELRGSRALRERIVIDTKQLRAQLALNPFVTINSGTLEFTADPLQHTFSKTPADSSLPALIYRDSLTADSIGVLASYGAHASTDANVIVYQIRTTVEYAIRHGLDSIVFELRTGYGTRSYGGTAMFAEDYNVDRWMFYAQDAIDQTKRPTLRLTFSYLK